ncbi:MAG TPA: hypothetical protein VII63_07015 [Caulobacteraceae bacterium]
MSLHPNTAAGLFAGVDDIIERSLGIGDIGTRQPRVATRSAAQRLSGRPPAKFGGEALIGELLARIEANWGPAGSARAPSKENWRLTKQLFISQHNTSPEKTLEKAIARVSGEAWANQVPTASGLLSGTSDKRRNIDLVFDRQVGAFELIELKHGSDTPLFAAVEALLYGVLYLVSRRHYPTLGGRTGPLLAARAVHLRVLAPVDYYHGWNFAWLEAALSDGLARTIAGRREFPQLMDFAFTAFPAGFRWPCGDEALAVALEDRRSARWGT